MASVSELDTATFQGGRGMPWAVWPPGVSAWKRSWELLGVVSPGPLVFANGQHPSPWRKSCDVEGLKDTGESIVYCVALQSRLSVRDQRHSMFSGWAPSDSCTAT